MERSQSHIPNDLFFSVLSKLPIKSLKRFGCVHKSWSLLFDNPYFMIMYSNNLLTRDHPYYHDVSVLLHQTFTPFDGYYYDERFENMNKLDWPSTKEFKFIPPSPFDSQPNCFVYAIHHPFGYDFVNNDYKVMRQGTVGEETNYETTFSLYIWEIYSLRKNS